MSTTIDTNIVEMRFDNKQFEQGCKESMSTLDKLKAKINSTSGESLDSLGKAANNVDLSKIEKTVDAVNSKFSVLGVVGATIIQDLTRSAINMAKNVITAVPNIIKEKGWSRAMNIEKAKFQLEGLHVAWKDISGDIDYAVSGTAYGLDAAANAASQLVASGVEVGDSMKAALRGISGVAAMTQSEYEEIAPIFTTIAGQGKVMTMQLRQVENRGLNAAATIADFFNGVSTGSVQASDDTTAAIMNLTKGLKVSEAEIREFVTDGQINFAMFAEAMDSTFGQHAKDANKTYEGVMKNIKSALGRIGADFYTPILQEEGPVVKFLQQVRNRIDEIRKAIQPMVKVWEQFLEMEGKKATKFMENLDVSFFGNLAKGLINIFNGLYVVFQAIRWALKDIIGLGTSGEVKSLSQAFVDLTAKLIPTQKTAEKIRATFRGVFSVFSIISTVLKQVISAITGVNPKFINLGDILLSITSTVGNLITYFAIWIKQHNVITPLLSIVTKLLFVMLGVIVKVVAGLIDLVKWVGQLPVTQKILKGIGDALYLIVGAVALLVTKIKQLVTAIKSGNLDELGFIGDTIIFIRDSVLGLIEAIGQLSVVQTLIEAITGAFEKFKEAADKLFGKSNSTTDDIVTISDELTPLAGDMKEFGASMEETGENAEQMATGIGGITAAIQGFIKSLPIGKIIAVGFGIAVAAALYKVVDAMQRFSKGVASTGSFLQTLSQRGVIGLIVGTGQYKRAPNHILDIAIAVGTLAASVIALSRIDNTKLNETITIMGKLAAGYVAVLFALTAMEKWLGFTGAIDSIGVAMLEIAAAMAVLGAAFAIISHSDFDKAQEAGQALAQMLIALTGISIIMGKFGGKFAKMGISFISLAASMYILVKALDTLSKMEDVTFESVGILLTRIGLLGVLGAEMMGLAKICDLLGGKSFLKLSIALLSLAVAMDIFIKIQHALPADFSQRLKDFIMGIADSMKEVGLALIDLAKWIGTGVLIVVAIVGAIAIVSGAVQAVVGHLGKITKNLSKIRKYQDYHKKALNTLALAALVKAIAVSVAIISVALIAVVKANLTQNMSAFIAGVAAIALMVGAMQGTVVLVGKYCKDTKGAGAAMIGTLFMMASIIVSTVAVASWIYGVLISEGDWKQKAAEFAVAGVSLGIVLGTLWLVTKSISQLKGLNLNKTTMTSIIAVVAGIGVIAASIAGLMYMFNNSPAWGGKLFVALVALAAAMAGLYFMVKYLAKMDQTNFKPSAYKSILALVAAIGVIAGSLAGLMAMMNGSEDWLGKIATATLGIVSVLAVMVACMNFLKDVKYNKAQQGAIKGMIGMLVAVSLSLATLMYVMQTPQDIADMWTAIAGLSLVFTAFAGMTTVMSKIKFNKNSWQIWGQMMLSLAGITAALILLTNYGNATWEAMISSAVAMSLVFAAFAGMTRVLSGAKFNKSQWVAFGGIALDAVAIAFALSLLTDAMKDPVGMIAAAVALSGVFAAFSFMSIMLSSANFNLTTFAAMILIAGDAVAVAFALSLLTDFKWYEMLTAAVALSATCLALAVAGVALGSVGVTALIGMVAMLGIAASALIVAKALSLLPQYNWLEIFGDALVLVAVLGALSFAALVFGSDPMILVGAIAMIGVAASILIAAKALSMLGNIPWTTVLADALILLGTMVILGVVAVVAAGLAAPLLIGAGVLAVLGAVLLEFSFAIQIAATAFQIFANAMSVLSPVILAFINGIVAYKDDLPTIALGLVELAGALAALGLAGVLLIPGSVGLLLTAAGLTALIPACQGAASVDISSLVKNLAALVVPGLAMALVGPALIIGAVGMSTAAAAMVAFASALVMLSAALNPKLMESLSAVGEQISNATKWGADLISNFVQGIKNSISKLKQAVKGIAQTIKDYLHFTQPDEGPLSDADTYMPDMIDLFADGIKEKYPTMAGAVDGLAGVIKDGASGIDLSGEGEGAAGTLINGFEGLLDGYSFDWHPYVTITPDIHENAATDPNAAKQEQIAARKQLREETAKTTEQELDFADALNTTGSAAGGASEKITDLTKAFEKVEKGSEVSLRGLMNNLNANNLEMARWAQDMKQLMGTNLDETLKQNILKMGVGGHETVKAYLKATEEEVDTINSSLQDYLTLSEKSEAYILGKYDKLGGLIGETITNSVMVWSSELADAIQSAIDPFAEFDDKTETSASTLISNMQSQIDGMTNWSNYIYDIMARTGKSIDDTFIQSLIEMGPKSYDEIHAMATATDEQLQQIVSLWDQQSHLGEDLAIQFAGRMADLGTNAGQGFIDGLSAQNEAIGQSVYAAFGTNGADYAEGIWEVASPSKRMIRMGGFIAEGLGKGIFKSWPRHVISTINITGRDAYQTFNDLLGYDVFFDIGYNISMGLAAGILAGQSAVIMAAIAVCTAAIQAAHQTLDEASPSKVFKQIGFFVSKGMAIGIENGTDEVTDSIDYVGNTAIDQMKSVIAGIAENVQNEFDGISPVITPRLDLTELQNGKSTMDRLLAAQTSANIASDISANLGGSNAINQAQPMEPSNNQTIIFNQTNNSPKNIDPYESYRLNRLAAEQLKGAFR